MHIDTEMRGRELQTHRAAGWRRRRVEARKTQTHGCCERELPFSHCLSSSPAHTVWGSAPLTGKIKTLQIWGRSCQFSALCVTLPRNGKFYFPGKHAGSGGIPSTQLVLYASQLRAFGLLSSLSGYGWQHRVF